MPGRYLVRRTFGCTFTPSTFMYQAPITPGRMLTFRASFAAAGVLRGIDLLPFPAVLQHVAAALAEATELALQVAFDRLAAAEVEEAAVLLDHFLAAFFARGGDGLGGGRLDLALQPAVERGQFTGTELVQAGGLELGGRHLLLQIALHHALGQRRRGQGQQHGGTGQQPWTDARGNRRHGGSLLGMFAECSGMSSCRVVVAAVIVPERYRR